MFIKSRKIFFFFNIIICLCIFFSFFGSANNTKTKQAFSFFIAGNTPLSLPPHHVWFFLYYMGDSSCPTHTKESMKPMRADSYALLPVTDLCIVVVTEDRYAVFDPWILCMGWKTYDKFSFTPAFSTYSRCEFQFSTRVWTFHRLFVW